MSDTLTSLVPRQRILPSAAAILLSASLLVAGTVQADSRTDIDWDDASLIQVEASFDRNFVPDGSDLWQELRTTPSLWFDEHNPRIRAEQPRYLGSPSYLTLVSKRAEPFLFHVVNALRQAQLPLELVALPIIESAYNPLAVSKSGAAGLWQFIPETGTRFGLARNRWYDGRHDLLDSTEAAMKYLAELRDHFQGDWLLAIAAYNAGENNVMRAIERNRERNLPTDYWSLQLPAETMAYVPRFLGVVAILRNPEAYQVSLHPIRPTPYFSTIVAGNRTSLQSVAQQLGAERELIQFLNAGYVQGTTPPGSQVRVVVPLGATMAVRSLPQVADQHLQQLVHHVRRGETLHRISRLYGVTLDQLRRSNQLSDDQLQVGQTLLIPES